MLYDPGKHSIHSLIYGQDPGVACLFWEAWAQWFLGYPDQALKTGLEALRLAKGLNYPYTMAIAHVLLAFVHHYRGDEYAVEKHADASIIILKEHAFEFFLEMAKIAFGWAKVKQGRLQEGISQIEQGLDSWRKTGAELFSSYWLAILAESYFKVGETERAISMIDEALEFSKNNSELFYEGELNRLQGEFLLALTPNDQTEAESSFRRAIDISRNQRAKSLELRAITSLGRLLKSTGRKDEAQHMLAEICGWFTEGFDTGDLRESKALLDELS
jgi:predicted ATPase